MTTEKSEIEKKTKKNHDWSALLLPFLITFYTNETIQIIKL